MARRGVLILSALVVGSLLMLVGGEGPPTRTSANHPYGWPNTNYVKVAKNTWYNFYAGTDRTHNITFRVCGSLGDPDVVVWALWQGWTLNSNYRYKVQWISDCGQGTNLLNWGIPNIVDYCGTLPDGGAPWGCWDSWCDDGGNVQGICKYDASHYGGANVNDVGITYVNSTAWSGFGTYTKNYVINHEFGHSNGMDDHALYSCEAYTIMSQGVQNSSCYPQYPTGNDFNTVNCNYYYQC